MHMNCYRPCVSLQVQFCMAVKEETLNSECPGSPYNGTQECMHALGFPKEIELASSAGDQRQHNVYKTCM